MATCEICGMEKDDVRMSWDMDGPTDVEGIPKRELMMCDVCRKKNRSNFDKLKNELAWVKQ